MGDFPPSRELKRRLTTQAGDSSLDGENAPPRIQAGAKSAKMHVDLCPRGDSQLTYTTPIALTTEFTLTSSGGR